MQGQIQQQQQIEAQAAQLELALKQAEVVTEQAEAVMNTVKSAVEHLKLAEAQSDLESKQIAQMRLRQSVGLPIV